MLCKISNLAELLNSAGRLSNRRAGSKGFGRGSHSFGERWVQNTALHIFIRFCVVPCPGGAALFLSGRGGHSSWERWSQFLGEVRFFCRDLSHGKCLSGACGADCLGEVPIILSHLSPNTLAPLPKPSHTSLKCCCQRDFEGRAGIRTAPRQLLGLA